MLSRVMPGSGVRTSVHATLCQGVPLLDHFNSERGQKFLSECSELVPPAEGGAKGGYW